MKKAAGCVTRNGTPARFIRSAVTYPPTMAKAPCARLMKFINPSVTESPLASTNSNMPYAMPSNRIVSMSTRPSPGRLRSVLRSLVGVLHVGNGVELDVVERAVLFLDLADIDVLHDLPRFRIDGDRSTRAHPAHALHCRQQRVSAGVALGLFQRLIDEPHPVIGRNRHEVRPNAVVGLLERLDEGLVLRRIVSDRVMVGRHGAKRRIADVGTQVVVGDVARTDQLDARLV